MIRVKDVRKSFGEKTVLKDINMNFEPGKCNMLIGASGSGKTLLMNIISGLVEPDSGEVYILGIAVKASLAESDRTELVACRIVENI